MFGLSVVLWYCKNLRTKSKGKQTGSLRFRAGGFLFVLGRVMDYKSKRWEKKREKILRRDKYLDKIAARYGRTEEAELVHHIYPAEDYPEYAWEDWNLISVSRKTHNKLHDRNTDKLTAEGTKLMERTVPKERRRT